MNPLAEEFHMGKGRRFQMLFGLGAGLLVAGYSLTTLVGCSNASTSSSRPAASSLKEGVTVLDATNASWGMNAAFVQGGRVVYIESRVGAPKPEVYRQDAPDEPANEMDLRFVDQENRTFFAQRGGDTWIDPTWTSEIAKSGDSTAPQVTPADLELNWSIARAGAAALPQALPATFTDHNYHLGVFAGMPSPSSDVALAARLAQNPAASADSQAYGSYSRSAWTQLTYVKQSKAAGCFFWVCGGSHTGVMMYINPNAGAWSVTIGACNHGTCPNTSGSGWKHSCADAAGPVFTGGVSVTGTTTGSTTGANDGLGGCQTAYSWSSGGNNHLCNDDAAYEMWQVGNGNTGAGPNSWIGTYNGFCEGSLCGSGSPAHYACTESNNGGSVGSWNTPNCF